MSDASQTSAGGGVAVIGACGGCGTSLVAGALALSWQRGHGGAWLIELDGGCGDLGEAWDLPGDRTLHDLVGVAGEMTAVHLRAAAQHHASGLMAIVAAPDRGAGDWGSAMSARLVERAADAAEGRCVIDAGSVLGPAAMGAVARARSVVLVCPPRISGVRRAVGVLAALAREGLDGGCGLVVGGTPGRAEIGTRALARVVGRDVIAELPWSAREAAELGAGRWPRGRRRGLATAMATLSERLR